MICNLGNASLNSLCLKSRGVLAGSTALDKSSSWTSQGMYYFDQHPMLFKDASGQYGQDTIAFVATSSSTQAVAERQVIAEYGTNDYWVGLVGMAYRPSPLGTLNVSSPLTPLLGNGTIPSLSFGYTAGSVYEDYNFGSLTLGGYDASRRSPQATENLELQMDRNTNELKVEVLDISVSNGTTSGERTLVPPGKTYSMFLDTSVSEFWLPSEVCDLFEGSFNITEDPKTGLFGIDNASRQEMFDNNTSLTFVLGASSDATVKLLIDLGPEAFGNFSYFPIRRAANDTLFVIGRTLFQETYITVDWTRGNYTLSKAQPRVQGIASSPQDISTPEVSPPDSHEFSSGVRAGIAVGCLTFLFVGLSLMWWLRRRRQQRRARRARDAATSAEATTEAEKDDKKPGLTSVDGDESRLTGRFRSGSEELDSTSVSLPAYTPEELMSNILLEANGHEVAHELSADSAAR